MRKHKVVATAIVTVSLVGTLTWTAFAAKANFFDATVDSTNISTSAKSLKNLLSNDNTDGESVSANRSSYGQKLFGFRFGMEMNTESICEILGMTQEELKQKLEENDGNIWQILEESGKLEEYKAAALSKYEKLLDEAVGNGKITREKADEMYAAAQETIANFDGSSGNNFKMRIGGKGDGEDMPSLEIDGLPEEWKNKIENFRNKLGDTEERIERSMSIVDIEVICSVLGMTKEELSQKLTDNDGNIYKILEDSGKLDEYKAATLVKYKELLDRKVADGRITQEKADEMYLSMKESIDNFDGNVRINFRTDSDGAGDKFKEKFQHSAGEDFTFNFSDNADDFGQRSNKSEGKTSAASLTVKDL